MSEQTIPVVVEAVGTIKWSVADPSGDDRWNEPQPVARVVDADGHRYIVTNRMCYRNGTTINDSVLGLKGTVETYRGSPIAFNCPTMFGKRGL